MKYFSSALMIFTTLGLLFLGYTYHHYHLDGDIRRTPLYIGIVLVVIGIGIEIWQQRRTRDDDY